LNVAISIALICACLVACGWLYQKAGERRDARRLPPPGEMLGGFHILRRGHVSPPIVFESGISASSLNWTSVLKLLPEDRRVITYDRPGLGWSPSSASPHTLDNIVADLAAVLGLAGVHEPVILVGHSFGGLMVRRFAQLHPGLVAALLLLDPLEPFEWNPITPQQSTRLARGVMLSSRGAFLARIGVVRLALDLLVAGSRGLPKLLARVTSGQGASVPDRFVGEVRKMPPEVWPAVRAHWCMPKSFETMAEYLARLPETCKAAESTKLPVPLPITVITASTSTEAVRSAHAQYATRHIIVPDAGHWVQLDNPALVAAEILRLP
jgi:pimeloyl-ACP methyl ester carboxylesterase